MLKIGFTNKYYTLWDIESQPNYSQNERGQVTLTHTKVIYTYLQNLSMNKEEAIEKAKNKGCKILEVDTDLFGRNSSWEFISKGYCDLPKNLSPFFEFGKYINTKIEDCNDLKYLEWYFDETKNRYAKNNLINNGYLLFEDNIVTSENYQMLTKLREERNLIQSELKMIEESGTGHIVFTPERNLSRGGKIEYKKGLFIRFKDVKQMYYNSNEYSLPIINGSAKKIKGKELVLLVRVIEDMEWNEKELEVIYVKSIDGKPIATHNIKGEIINN